MTRSIDSTPKTPSSAPKPEGLYSILPTIAVLLAAPLIALILTAFVFQSYQVDGESMETTLQHNDRLIIWKTPKTWARLSGHKYLPHRGDIIVFVERGMIDGSSASNKQLIKRVVGLPGERVVVRDNILTVYNKDHPEGFQPDTTLPYGTQHQIGPTIGEVDVVVPENQVFACGDNRTNSLDSRSFGTIPSDDIVGKLTIRLLPLNKIERF